jgi:hypothetical protein
MNSQEAFRSLQRGGAGVGGEVVLAGKPADFTGLTQERGRQHGPHAEQLDQAGVGLGNRRLDARLAGGDALVQLAHVGDEVGGQLPAGDRRRTSGRDRGQQPSRAVAVRLRRAPPGTRSISSRWSRLMVWVRAATKS